MVLLCRSVSVHYGLRNLRPYFRLRSLLGLVSSFRPVRAAVGKRDELGIALVLFSLAATATECISICERLSDLLLSLIPPSLPSSFRNSVTRTRSDSRIFALFGPLALFLNFSPLYFTYVMA